MRRKETWEGKSWWATSEVRKIKDTRVAKPKADPTNQFLPSSWVELAALRKWIDLNWGLAVIVRRKRVRESSSIWRRTSDSTWPAGHFNFNYGKKKRQLNLNSSSSSKKRGSDSLGTEEGEEGGGGSEKGEINHQNWEEYGGRTCKERMCSIRYCLPMESLIPKPTTLLFLLLLSPPPTVFSDQFNMNFTRKWRSKKQLVTSEVGLVLRQEHSREGKGMDLNRRQVVV